MWVVKLAGGLAQEPALGEWLSELMTLGGGRIVIVPGRWSSAEFVRTLQQDWQLDDLSAYNMMVLARAQYGVLMNGLAPDLVPAVTAEDIRAVLQRGGVAVWMPFSLMRQDIDEMANVDLSSDCVAAWLAAHLNAERLVLLKSRPFNPEATLAEQVRDGILDERFSRYLSTAACPVDLMHKYDVARMRALLLNGAT